MDPYGLLVALIPLARCSALIASAVLSALLSALLCSALLGALSALCSVALWSLTVARCALRCSLLSAHWFMHSFRLFFPVQLNSLGSTRWHHLFFFFGNSSTDLQQSPHSQWPQRAACAADESHIGGGLERRGHRRNWNCHHP